MKLFTARPPQPPAGAPIQAAATDPLLQVAVARRRRTASPAARRVTPRRACSDSPFTPHDAAAPKRCGRCAALLLFGFAFRSRLLLTPNRVFSAAAPRRRSVTAAPAPARCLCCRPTRPPRALKLPALRRRCASRLAPCWRPRPARRARCVLGRATRRCRFASWRCFARRRGAPQPPCCAAQPRSSSTWLWPSPGRACPDHAATSARKPRGGHVSAAQTSALQSRNEPPHVEV